MQIIAILRSVAHAAVVWVALRIWWAASIRINIWLSPALPLYAALAFGVPIAFRSKIAFSIVLGPRLSSTEFWWSFVGIGLGLAVCVLTSLICFSYADGPAAVAVPSNGLAGAAAKSSAFLFPAYLALVEEISFRGQLQGRLTPVLGNFRSIGLATAAFVAIHIPNAEFSEYWPMYLAISLVCGILVSTTGALAGAILVHVSFNIIGAAFGPWLNRSTGALESNAGRVLLFLALLMATSLFALLLLKSEKMRLHPRHEANEEFP